MNYIYGILSNNRVASNSSFYRYSDAVRNEKQSIILSRLFSANDSSDYIGASIDFIIKLLRTSEHWQSFVKKYDELNTYNLKITGNGETGISWDNLLAWTESISASSAEFVIYDDMSNVEKVINTIFTVLTLK